MAEIYFDHDVAIDIAILLRPLGHAVTSTREARQERARDDIQLLSAARRGLILVTHNRKDFELLHDAWRNWSAEWGVSPIHHGVLIIAQPPHMSYERAAQEIHRLVQSGLSLSNELYVLRPASGWLRSA